MVKFNILLVAIVSLLTWEAVSAHVISNRSTDDILHTINDHKEVKHERPFVSYLGEFHSLLGQLRGILYAMYPMNSGLPEGQQNNHNRKLDTQDRDINLQEVSNEGKRDEVEEGRPLISHLVELNEILYEFRRNNGDFPDDDDLHVQDVEIYGHNDNLDVENDSHHDLEIYGHRYNLNVEIDGHHDNNDVEIDGYHDKHDVENDGHHVNHDIEINGHNEDHYKENNVENNQNKTTNEVFHLLGNEKENVSNPHDGYEVEVDGYHYNHYVEIGGHHDKHDVEIDGHHDNHDIEINGL